MHFSEFGREGLIIQGRERGMAVGRLGVMEKGRGGFRRVFFKKVSCFDFFNAIVEKTYPEP